MLILTHSFCPWRRSLRCVLLRRTGCASKVRASVMSSQIDNIFVGRELAFGHDCWRSRTVTARRRATRATRGTVYLWQSPIWHVARPRGLAAASKPAQHYTVVLSMGGRRRYTGLRHLEARSCEKGEDTFSLLGSVMVKASCCNAQILRPRVCRSR
jgi:hypothetical protein